MSRRKQSVPCKVAGSNLPIMKEERATNLLKLHSLTDSLLSKSGELYDNTLNTSTDPSSVSLREFALPASRLHSGKKQEQTYVATDVISSATNSSHSLRTDKEQEDVVDPKQMASDNKQQRFSARLRARLLSVKKSDEQSVAVKRKAEEMGNSALSKRKLLMLDNESNTLTPTHNRTRTISSEEELMCPVCHKAFKSKYGLLTHSEIHSTPELKCSFCNLSFPSRSALVTHWCTQHSSASNNDCSYAPVAANNGSVSKPSAKALKAISGFTDLSFIDFTCKRFSVISEDVCSKRLHRLTEKDRRYYFMCKRCSLLYPTISALKYHVEKSHPDTKQDQSDCDKSENAKTCAPSTEKSPSSGSNEELENEARMKYLNLNPVSSVNTKETKTSALVNYNMDSESVRTSPMVAYLNVPQWLRQPGSADDVVINVQDFSEIRPPLKIKLVRRRDDEGNAMSLVSNYFVDEQNNGSYLKDDDGNQEADNIDGGGHRASTTCGIGVHSTISGRRMFSCRLCNYASFEKSTILRHQRTHTGVRPYSCKFCDIAFTTKANCERHIRKRHQMRVASDVDVKNSVFCDYDLLKKARDGELNLPQSSQQGTGSRLLSFQCRSCKAVFSSRSNGVRHVMSKHGILNRKGANEQIVCTRIAQGRTKHSYNNSTESGRYNMDFISAEDGRRNKPSANLRRMNDKFSSFVDMDGESKRSLKPPSLIPLTKIRAYNESSKKLLLHFQKNYDDVLAAANVDHTSQDARAMSSKLLSLIVSSASMIKQDKATNQSEFTPVDELPDFSFHQRSSTMEVDASNNEALDYSMKSIEESKNQQLTNQEQFNDEYQDIAQLYADGQLTGDYPDLPVDADTFISSEHMDSFKPWHDAEDGSFMLPQSVNDLASIEDLVDLAQQSSVVPPSSHDEDDDGEDYSRHKVPHKRSSNGEMRKKNLTSKYKQYQTTSNHDRSLSSWKFIPEHPKMRDEKGRYVRNPHSPYPPIKPAVTSYSHLDDRPTMVSLQSGRLNLPGHHKKHSSFIQNRSKVMKGGKCPKCDKVFPWASSLSRHIMTHTGLKPFMCARCSMRFTTRSNLLRHAYRRHGLVRGSEERHSLLVTLSVSEQKAHAEKEAEKLIEQEGVSSLSAEEEQVEEVDELINETREELKSMNGVVHKPDEGAAHFNKRYICGLCRLPFANRSNLVRHLHRLHSITKDHSNFRSLLIRISKGASQPKPSSARSEFSPKEKTSPIVNGVASGQRTPNAHRLKAFTCSICSIGFTKRNNAARHIQHQHNINRKSLNFHELIIRNHPSVDGKFNDSPTNGIENNFAPETNDISGAMDESLPYEPLEGNEESNVEKDPLDGASRRPSVQLTIDCGGPIDADLDTNPAEKSDVSLPINNSPINEGSSNFQPIQENIADTPLAQPGKRKYTTHKKIKHETESPRVESSSTAKQNKEIDSVKEADKTPKSHPVTKQGKRKDRPAQFVCGVCKRIHKDVEELKIHLEDHNIPHPWHCSICGVPFTNKYNCQRHLMRRHGVSDVEPKYVEDVKHGPRVPRKRSKGYGH